MFDISDIYEDSIKNYMDYFQTPEEYIKVQLTKHQRKGKYQFIFKDDMIKLAFKSGLTVKKTDTKLDILHTLLTKYTYHEIAEYFKIGASSWSFQVKFNITHKEVLKLVKLGYIKVVGETAKNKGLTCNVFDYYRLTKEEVYEALGRNLLRLKL